VAILQRRLSKCGLSRQTAKGAAATSATYGYGVDGGSIFKLDLTENEIPLTWSNLDILGFDRSGVKPSQAIGTVATPNLIGLLLLGALGSDTVTGASSPYTHTITPAASLPYLTAWGAFGGTDYAQIVDTKVSSLELSWEAAGRVTAKASLLGITPSFLASMYTETANEVLSSVGFFTAGGGVFSIESVGAQVTGGSVKIDNHVAQPVVASTVLPADVVEGKREITWSLKLLPTDTHLFREVYFGASTLGALSGISAFPRLGAVSVQFAGPSSTTLTISSASTRFMVEFPESSPDGGPAELTLAGTSVLPASGPAVTATLLNSVASY
jgi:hypothetical protein